MLPLAAAALLVIFAGCGGGDAVTDPDAPPAPDDVAGWARRLPDNRYITAWGVSADSRRQAELDAQAQVAARIRSSLSAETSSLARAVMKDTEVHDFQELVSDVRSITTFSRAELIRIVDPTAHVDEQGRHRVLAALRRGDLAEALQTDYDARALPFRGTAGRLDSAAGDLPGWTAAWMRLRVEFADLVATAAEMRAGSGISPSGFAADQRRWERSHAARDSVLDGLDLVLVLRPAEGVRAAELDRAELSERLWSGLAGLGVPVTDDRCRPGATRLELTPRLTWQKVIGEVASLELRGELAPCDGGPVWTEVVLDGPAMRGDGRDPLDDLLKGLTPEALAPLLQESLGHVVPF